MSVSRTVSEIFSVKEWHDLETGGRGRSSSLKMVLFDRPYTTFYWSNIANKNSSILYRFYPATRMHSVDYIVATCLSVCPSHAGIV